MGQDKGSMVVYDKPMIIHILESLNNQINEVVVVLNNKERIEKYKEFINKYAFNYKITFVEDEIKNKGPLSGIMTGLKNINNDYALVLPCDSPYINNEFINDIFTIKSKINVNFDILVPYHQENQITNTNVDTEKIDKREMIENSEPLHSIYNKSLINNIEILLNGDILDVKSLIEKSNPYFIFINNNFNNKNFKNINKKSDIE